MTGEPDFKLEGELSDDAIEALARLLLDMVETEVAADGKQA